jgi:hypothetical protein
MAYDSQWERLSDAVERIMAAGLSKEEAQTDVCRAIADEAVKIRGKLKRHTTKPLTAAKTVLEGKDFHIPSGIKSNDLDWEKSRPLKPWPIRHEVSGLSGFWHLEWIELSRSDLTAVLCSVATRGEPAQRASSGKHATNRSRPGLERAQRAIKELYRQGVPSQAAEPNKILCRRVAEKLNQDGQLGVSNDTILRAAGRRK